MDTCVEIKIAVLQKCYIVTIQEDLKTVCSRKLGQ